MSKSGLVPRVQCPRPVLLTPTACHHWKSGKKCKISKRGENSVGIPHTVGSSTSFHSLSEHLLTARAGSEHFRSGGNAFQGEMEQNGMKTHASSCPRASPRSGAGWDRARSWGGQPRCSDFSPLIEHQPEPSGAKKSSCRNWEILFEGDFAL